MSEAEMREGITRAYAGSAASALYLLQDSFPPKNNDCDMKSKRPMKPARKVDGIQGQAYQLFWNNIGGACARQRREQDELSLRSSARPCQTSLSTMQRWVASGLERLSWACERSGTRLFIYDGSFDDKWLRLHFRQEISLDGKLEPPQISLLLLVVSGCDLENALDLLAQSPPTAFRPIFDATVFAVTQGRANVVMENGRHVIRYDNAMKRVLRGLRLISRLLELGLEPNAVRQDLTSYASFYIPGQSPDPKHATCWKSYSVLVKWIFSNFPLIGASFEIYTAVSEVTRSFVEHGADMNAQVTFLEAPQIIDVHDMCYRMVTVAISAHQMIDLWTSRSGQTYQIRNEEDKQFWSDQGYEVTAIIEKDFNTTATLYRILVSFTDEQQAELRLRLREHWVASVAQARTYNGTYEEHPSTSALIRSLRKTVVDNEQDVVVSDQPWTFSSSQNRLYALEI